VDTETISGDIIITFSIGDSALYSAGLLNSNINQVAKLHPEPVAFDSGMMSGGKNFRTGTDAGHAGGLATDAERPLSKRWRLREPRLLVGPIESATVFSRLDLVAYLEFLTFHTVFAGHSSEEAFSR
jgi:hypothetical protein